MRAVDIHCHPMTKEWDQAFGQFTPGLEATFKQKYPIKSEEEMAEDFRKDDVVAMMIGWDAESATGAGRRIDNDWIASLSEKYPDVFLPGWAVVDPWKQSAACEELERAIKDLGLTGAKFQPPVQAFYPNDHRFYPMWDTLQSLGAPALIHAGTTGLGWGLPGGGGVHLKYGRPIPGIDDVAADFPDLTIIAAHPGHPWHEELIAILVHKPNVYLDVCGWRPRYIPESLKRQIRSRLKDKVLFGSDYPSWTPGQCIKEFEEEGYGDDVLQAMFFDNATRVLNLRERVPALFG